MTLRAAALALALAAAQAAWGWGNEGHEIVATIAYARIGKATRAKVDALLAADPDALTAPDFVARSTWADRFRDQDRATTKLQYEATRRWHFADIELGGGTLAAACHGHPPLPAGIPASQGPADDCLVDKIEQFRTELAATATPPTERLVALKYLIHLVGDLHQPLHASDDHDAGGNAVPVRWGDLDAAQNLHAYWDRRLVRLLGPDPRAVGAALNRSITAAQARAWRRGTSADWAYESWTLAKTVAYDFSGESKVPDERGDEVLELDAAYELRALPVVREQLARAGVRLATLLDAALK